MTNDFNANDDESTETNDARFGLQRRRVLQAVGATAVASPTIGQVGASSHNPNIDRTHEPVATSAQFKSFSALLDGSHSNADLIRKTASAGLDAYEPYFIDNASAMLQAQQDTGVYMSSAHVAIEDVENDAQAVADTYAQFEHDGRTPAIVDSGIDGGWDSESGVQANAERINAAKDAMAEYGFEFGYHNGSAEFQYLDEANDRRAYDALLENLDDDVYLQLDVGGAFAGEGWVDVLEYIVPHGDRLGSVHIRNLDEDDNDAEIHEGIINQRANATAARNASNADHLVYDYPDSPAPQASFEHASEWMNEINSPWEPGGIPGIPNSDVHPSKIHEPSS
jgi:sugar phosphate isomerase/epimerase